MSLPVDLLSQFVKTTNDKKETKNDTITYGTIYKEDDKYLVKLDGADITMPVSISQLSSGIITSKDGTRVVVLIKNHTATILSSLEPQTAQVTTLDGVTINLSDIETIKADNIIIKETLYAEDGEFKTLKTDNAEVKGTLTAVLGDIDYLKTNFITADDIEATYATLENVKATWLKVFDIEGTYGEFEDLAADKLSAIDTFVKNANITFANINFSNIGDAAIENLFATSGLIENVVVDNGTITGELVGVTIKGDLIEGNTIVADKLVIKGEDGLYYKLNTDGVTTEADQTEYNSINGSIITAKTITATQISVSDLVAFDATIGGFTISDDAIYSEVKDTEDNTTRGTYIGADGTVNFGDGNRFIKYYQDEDGNWKLAISADTVLYDVNGSPHSLADLGFIGEYVKIATYDGEPCIELGETDSDFKLLITNTRMLFMEGSSIIAHISNQSLHIKKAVIEEELQQGDFVWKVHANGNMGLMWKGEV